MTDFTCMYRTLTADFGTMSLHQNLQALILLVVVDFDEHKLIWQSKRKRITHLKILPKILLLLLLLLLLSLISIIIISFNFHFSIVSLVWQWIWNKITEIITINCIVHTISKTDYTVVVNKIINNHTCISLYSYMCIHPPKMCMALYHQDQT